MIPWLDPSAPPHFPPTASALTEPNGLLAAGGALSPAWLVTAYRNGIFPWYQAGEPILWWSPSPRMVLLPEAFRLHRSLKQRMKHAPFVTRVDTAFEAVVAACATTRREGTWITPAMRDAYTTLHRLGFAHSVEVWHDERLVGGLYGVCLDHIFFGESMFHFVADASKMALARLVLEAFERGIILIDCQMSTAHLRFMGGVTLPRDAFERVLARAISAAPKPQGWGHAENRSGDAAREEPCSAGAPRTTREVVTQLTPWLAAARARAPALHKAFA
ncbi:leucyl/phenylalanyl-tRNA--protein transferase [Hydrogenophilus thiooxidans]|uniref:leucyl/phenylalanyl-tRNA--protein transferase n=1 Tax=Hydrogenophilus thiooxidans TaxID=2820326 RepID=UPI001C225497|nr:leucyl/phenylalanyl-tRNA--protein transferase [Hydrogenophilus thiooxidans]